MTDNHRTDHFKILKSTGRFKRTSEQEDTIREYMGDLELELELEEDVESTLELPQIRRK